MAYAVTICARQMDALFDLRGEKSVVAQLATACGLVLPSRPNSIIINGVDAVLWIGPARWIVRSSVTREDQLADRFTDAIGERFANATMISDMLMGFEISGEQARDVLAQGCPLDLHPQSYPLGSATATEVYGVAVILCLEDDPFSFTLYVDRSYSDFVLGRLRNGAAPGTTSV